MGATLIEGDLLERIYRTILNGITKEIGGNVPEEFFHGAVVLAYTDSRKNPNRAFDFSTQGEFRIRGVFYAARVHQKVENNVLIRHWHICPHIVPEGWEYLPTGERHRGDVAVIPLLVEHIEIFDTRTAVEWANMGGLDRLIWSVTQLVKKPETVKKSSRVRLLPENAWDQEALQLLNGITEVEMTTEEHWCAENYRNKEGKVQQNLHTEFLKGGECRPKDYNLPSVIENSVIQEERSTYKL